MTGVRVYFAAYPEKEGQNTLFFAPTGHKVVAEANMLNLFTIVGKDENIPVDPLNDGSGSGSGNGYH